MLSIKKTKDRVFWAILNGYGAYIARIFQARPIYISDWENYSKGSETFLQCAVKYNRVSILQYFESVLPQKNLIYEMKDKYLPAILLTKD